MMVLAKDSIRCGVPPMQTNLTSPNMALRSWTPELNPIWYSTSSFISSMWGFLWSLTVSTSILVKCSCDIEERVWDYRWCTHICVTSGYFLHHLQEGQGRAKTSFIQRFNDNFTVWKIVALTDEFSCEFSRLKLLFFCAFFSSGLFLFLDPNPYSTLQSLFWPLRPSSFLTFFPLWKILNYERQRTYFISNIQFRILFEKEHFSIFLIAWTVLSW